MSSESKYLIPGAIIFAGLLVALSLYYGRPSSQTVSPPSLESEPAAGAAAINVEKAVENSQDDPILGNPQAPVTMVVFGDFQCHFCKKFDQEIRPLIIEKYVKTGQVKMIYRDFAFLGPASKTAAQAANCALEQGQYWAYVDILHQNQGGHDASAFTGQNLKKFAQDLGLNSEKFSQCLDSGKYLKEVEQDFQDGRSAGVTGTPTSFINERKIDGVLPFETFAKVIEEELAKSQ